MARQKPYSRPQIFASPLVARTDSLRLSLTRFVRAFGPHGRVGRREGSWGVGGGGGGGEGGLAECLVLLQDSGYRMDIGVDVEEVADGGGPRNRGWGAGVYVGADPPS